MMQSFIDELEVFCEKRSEGCFWKGRYDERPMHMSTCKASEAEQQIIEIKSLRAQLQASKHTRKQLETQLHELQKASEQTKKQLEKQLHELQKMQKLQSWFHASVASAPPEVRVLLQSGLGSGSTPGSSGVVSQQPTSEREAKSKKQVLSNADWVILKKKVVKEGGKRGAEIEGAADMNGLQFFCTRVFEPDGDLDLLKVSMHAMNAKSDPTGEMRKGECARIGKMIFSAGSEQLAVLAYIPKALKKHISGIDWLKRVIDEHGGWVTSDSSATLACGIVPTDRDKGRYSLKIRESCITAANSYLKSKGLFPDSDDSDDDSEVVFGDDLFPS